MSTYALISDLPLVIESHELERLEHQVSSEFTRVTTVIHLRGGGEEGLGEDVVYSVEDHDRFHAIAPGLPLAGRWTLDSFSRQLDGLELFPEPPGMEAFRDYRRWALESAALDLALRQEKRSWPTRWGGRRSRFASSSRRGRRSSCCGSCWRSIRDAVQARS